MGSVTSRVGIVFVSHSALIARGLVDLARQMAPEVSLQAAGGTEDDGIGTSLERIRTAIIAADSGAGVVMLCDLGSAIMTAESAIDFLDDEQAGRVRLADAPLVEGGVAAAVAAETGGSLDIVVRAAESAAGATGGGADAGGGAVAAPAASGSRVSRSVTLINKDGLHARPAAEFVKLASTFPARVTVNGKDAKSLLGIMALGLTMGTTAEIASDEPGGAEAVAALADLVESGFGEKG